MVTRALSVRARVARQPGDAHERLSDSLADMLIGGAPFARERIPTLWSDDSALRKLAEAKRAALPPALVTELIEMHRRLGATPASLASVERLGRGEAVCTIAGQQPAPLGGPLYSLHKTAAAVGLAERVTERTGVPCVPVYWTHTEDSDFEEIRSVTVADPTLQLHDLSLPETMYEEGTLLGNLPAAPATALGREAFARWAGLPELATLEALWSRVTSAARDLGELQSALMLACFGERGLVVVDPRLPSFRQAARVIVDRYLSESSRIAEAASRAGELLETKIGRRPLADSALESFVFVVRDGVRRKISAVEALALPTDAPLVPSVALRPAVQDGVLPTVAMACGPGELAYLAQLREVFEALGVKPASPVPRFAATWLPSAAVELIEKSKADPWEVVAETDGVVRRLAETRVPPSLRQSLEQARTETLGTLERFSAASTQLDASLPQMVDSARGKIDYQFGRLLDGVTSKVRHKLEREHPEWLRLRYYLSPGDKLQERRIATLEPFAYRGPGLGGELSDLAAEHAAALERGSRLHYLVDL
jgi:uncharacterized protein YllA (UPF0747 family)